MSEVLEPLAPKFGDKPSIPIGCNRLQPIGKFGVATVLVSRLDDMTNYLGLDGYPLRGNHQCVRFLLNHYQPG